MTDEADKKKHEAEEAQEEMNEAPEDLAQEAEADSEPTSEEEQAEGAPDKITELEEQVGQMKDALLRALAETENLRRRSQREKEEALKYAPASLAKALLPVADNLRRALDSVPEELRADERLSALLSGVELTERELLGAFAKNGIERIDPVGEKLDPNWHEAMFEVPDAEKPAGTVVQVVEVGYRLQDRLLRPARVGVSRQP
ncbi:nucleotide exchange factor GrpE [Limibacillus halophilus]